jgi:hypothetical protein
MGSGFDTGPVRVGFVVGRVALEQDFLQLRWFCLISIVPLMLCTHLLIYRCYYLAVDIVIKHTLKKQFILPLLGKPYGTL